MVMILVLLASGALTGVMMYFEGIAAYNLNYSLEHITYVSFNLCSLIFMLANALLTIYIIVNK